MKREKEKMTGRKKVEPLKKEAMADKGELGTFDYDAVKAYIAKFSQEEIKGLVAAASVASAKPLILADGKSAEAVLLAVRMAWNGPWGVQKSPEGPGGTVEKSVQEMIAKPTGENDEDGHPKYHISNTSWKEFVRGVAKVLTEVAPDWGTHCYYKTVCVNKYGYHFAKPWPLNKFDDLPNEMEKKKYCKALKRGDEEDSEDSEDEEAAAEEVKEVKRARGAGGKKNEKKNEMDES